MWMVTFSGQAWRCHVSFFIFFICAIAARVHRSFFGQGTLEVPLFHGSRSLIAAKKCDSGLRVIKVTVSRSVTIRFRLGQLSQCRVPSWFFSCGAFMLCSRVMFLPRSIAVCRPGGRLRDGCFRSSRSISGA